MTAWSWLFSLSTLVSIVLNRADFVPIASMRCVRDVRQLSLASRHRTPKKPSMLRLTACRSANCNPLGLSLRQPAQLWQLFTAKMATTARPTGAAYFISATERMPVSVVTALPIPVLLATRVPVSAKDRNSLSAEAMRHTGASLENPRIYS